MSDLLDEYYDAVDYFAGAGGWDVAGRMLGLVTVGVELDDAAHATRKAAGLPTLQLDIAKLDPLTLPPAEGFIASPPCPTFSAAGNGGGRMLTEILVDCMTAMAAGQDTRAAARSAASAVLAPIYRAKAVEEGKMLDDANARAVRDADMSVLVVEPLRYIVARRPEWVALEQVPAVLKLWEHMARLLEQLGYEGTWTGRLSSETFGDPQTRTRAILLARLDGPVHPPAATHRAYVKGEPADGGEMALFGGDLLPWRSMAAALGWGMTQRPSVPVVGAGGEGGGPRPLDGGAGARSALADAKLAGDWSDDDVVELVRGAGMVERHGPRAGRRGDEPAPTITVHEGGGCGTNLKRRPAAMRQTNQANATERSIDEPAATIAAGHSTLDRVWVQTTNFTATERNLAGERSKEGSQPFRRDVDDPAPTIDGQVGSWKVLTSRDDGEQERSSDEPAPTVGGTRSQWTRERPATTVNAEAGARISAPGHHDPEESGSQQKDSITVSVEEAAALQSFPEGFPWQGNQTQKYRQIGNAVPVLMARATLLAADPRCGRCVGCGREGRMYDDSAWRGDPACETCVTDSFAEHG